MKPRHILPSPVSAPAKRTLGRRSVLPRSCRGPLPRTLVFSSVGDRGQAVRSWCVPPAARDYQVALVYYGRQANGAWARSLKASADHFAVHPGGKFPNLLWWTDQHPGLLDAFDYVLVLDDDLAFSPETIGRIVRTAKLYDLPVAAAAQTWDGKISWLHLGARGHGPRSHEAPGGVELTNFVEMNGPLLETAALKQFLDLFRRYADRLTGWGTDWLIASACFSDRRPFGILQNVTMTNPRRDREIDTLQPALERERAWRTIAATDRLPLTRGEQIRTWLPAPRMRCINLARATERRARFAADWIEGRGLPIEFFTAYDRRDVEAGRLVYPYDEAAAWRRIGRPMTAGEIACATSHALVMAEERAFCGPEGVVLFEDDCASRPGADRLVERVERAIVALPGVDAVAGHAPYLKACRSRERGGQAMRMLDPPWGSSLTWYSPSGLDRAESLLRRMDGPADWIWHEFCALGTFAMLDPAVAEHNVLGTTYIGNDYRGVHRQYVP